MSKQTKNSPPEKRVLNPDGTAKTVESLTGELVPVTGDTQFDNFAAKVLRRVEEIWKESDDAFMSAQSAFELDHNPEHHQNMTRALTNKQKALDQTVFIMKEITRYNLKIKEIELKMGVNKNNFDLTDFANNTVEEAENSNVVKINAK